MPLSERDEWIINEVLGVSSFLVGHGDVAEVAARRLRRIAQKFEETAPGQPITVEEAMRGAVILGMATSTPDEAKAKAAELSARFIERLREIAEQGGSIPDPQRCQSRTETGSGFWQCDLPEGHTGDCAVYLFSPMKEAAHG